MSSATAQRRNIRPLAVLSPGSRQRKDASLERALRTITSPKKSFSEKQSKKDKDKQDEESVKVAIRIRPLTPRSVEPQCARRAFHVSSDKISVVESSAQTTNETKPYTTPRRRSSSSEETKYTFDKVFGEEDDTRQIYGDLVRDIVRSVSEDGINGTVFTYGQTSSGKTFTMQGCKKNDVNGIIQLAANDIFKAVDQDQTDNEQFTSKSESVVKVSYVEIYNEELRDLLTDNKRKASPTPLVIREDKRGTISVENLKEVVVRTLDQLMEVFRIGESNKSIGSTKMNDRSSRSHAVFKITIEKKTMLNTQNIGSSSDDKENSELAIPVEDQSKEFVVKTSCTLTLVDLAGSESVRLTGATGMQKKEGGMINQSLLTLSKVLTSLGERNPGHVNYRDSKLTRMLKPSLSGARMAVICCISPSDQFVEETRSTLQFASRAKLVKTKAMPNKVVENDGDVIAALRYELEHAKLANKKLQSLVTGTGISHSGSNLKPFETRLQTQLDNLKRFVLSREFGDRHQIVPLHSKHFTDDDLFSHLLRKKSTVETLSKTRDDSLLPLRINVEELVRVALVTKAKQVRQLQEQLSGKKTSNQTNYSRFSLSAYQDIDRYKSQSEELESKLENANSLISSLENQVDELSSQKNDALDWIEELFDKSEFKDKQLAHVTKERDEAVAKTAALSVEMTKTKHLLEFTIGEKEETTARMRAMKTEIDALKYCVDTCTSTEAQIMSLKQDISDLKSERDELLENSKADSQKRIQLEEEIKDLQASVVHAEESSKQKLTRIESLTKLNDELHTQVKRLTLQVESQRGIEDERIMLVNRVKFVEDELTVARDSLKAKSIELNKVMMSRLSQNEMIRNKMPCSGRRIDACNEDENELEEEVIASRESFESKSVKVGLTRHRVTDKMTSKLNCRENEILSLRKDLESARECISRAEQAGVEADGLREQLMVIEKKEKETSRHLRDTQKKLSIVTQENQRLENRGHELHGSVSRVRELVEDIATKNSELKEENESYRRNISELESRVREQICIIAGIISERDVAINAANEMKTSILKLKQSYDQVKIQNEALTKTKEMALVEKEKLRLKLDKMAADFEADYETLREKIDSLLREKLDMEKHIVLLEASKVSIENNADRILKRDHTINAKYDRLKTELKKVENDLAEREDEISQLTKRLDYFKAEKERLVRDNSALRDAISNTKEPIFPDPSRKRRKLFDFIPGET